MTRKFILGVIGTQNTGKSTFIKDLIEYYKNNKYPFKTVGCDYRKKVEESGLKINREGNLESQKIIFDTLVEQLNIIDKIDSDGNFVTDRTPLDAYVYTLYLKENRPDLNITDEDLDEMFKKLKTSMQIYDRIIFLDLNNCGNVELVDDKFRDTNPEYRMTIDRLFKKTIKKLGKIFGNYVDSDIIGNRNERIEMFVNRYSDNLID